MPLSIIEKKLVESIREDLKEQKHSVFKLSFLSARGAAELLNERYITFDLRKLNNKTAAELIGMINNNEVLDSANELERYDLCKYILFGRSMSFLKKYLNDYPLLITYYLLSRNELFLEAINTFSISEKKFLFDSYFELTKNHNFFISNNDIFNYMVSLDDEDKIRYLENSVYNLSFEELDNFFSSFKSREAFLRAASIYCNKAYIAEFLKIDKYVTTDELLQIIKPNVIGVFWNVDGIIAKFNFQQQLELLSYLLVNNASNRYSVANAIIKDNVAKTGKLDVYNDLNRFFVERGESNVNLDFKYAKEIITELSGEELFNLYVNSSYEPIKMYIRNDKSLWQKEPFFSYIMANELEFVCSYVSKTDKLDEREKSIFLSKEFLLNTAKKLPNNQEFYSTVLKNADLIQEYFKDIEFAHALLKSNPNFLDGFYNEKSDPDLIRFAFQNGYIPNLYFYNKYKDREDIIKVLYESIAEFDSKRDDFSSLFNSMINITDAPEIVTTLMQKAADNLSMSYESFSIKLEALRKVNSEILDTLDYRLFDERFSFLNVNKIEVLGANKHESSRLCGLTSNELNAVKQVLLYSSSINWIDLLDRILSNVHYYKLLFDDLSGRSLTSEEVEILLRVIVHPNYLKINSYDDLIKYDELVDKRVSELLETNNVENYKKLNALALLGIDYNEFQRIYNVYCNDLERFCKESNNEDLKKILTLIKNIEECDSVLLLKEVYENTPRLKLKPELIVNLDSELRREFLKLYNDSVYKIDSEDKIMSLGFTSKVDENGKVIYVPAENGTGVEVQFYSPIGLGEEQKDFSIITTSLGAYSDHSEPDDYYSNWNVDLIRSHGFCCSYLKNDNLGTARICHACLGFTDFDSDALLLSAPYDINSNNANMQFNTARGKEAKFYTPRGMVNETRHTHNEMVFERRNLNGGGTFKKEPSYTIFFCNDFNSLTEEEKKIYESTVKAAIQLGKDGEPLPVIVIDRNKISKYQHEQINNKVNGLLQHYNAGVAKDVIVTFINNEVGNTYAQDINNRYFNEAFKKSVISRLISAIINLKKNGQDKEAFELFSEVDETLKEEVDKAKEINLYTMFVDEFNKFKRKMSLLSLSTNDSKTFNDMITAIAGTIDNNCLNRWNKAVNSDNENYFMLSDEIIDKIMPFIDFNLLLEKVKELEKDNLYITESPYNNRYIANKFLFTLLMMGRNNLISIDSEVLLDVIKYQRCSYMDGESSKNVLSSVNKAEKLMKEKNYDQQKIDKIKLLIFLQDKRNITMELVNDIIEKNQLNSITSFNLEELKKAINVIHDSECLEHSRFITAGEVEQRFFYDSCNYWLSKFAYQLEESYALGDIDEYVRENSDKYFDIQMAKKEMLPQELIRNIRKGRKMEFKKEYNTYESAFLEIDIAEKTDPLNLIEEKMKKYEGLPEQVSIMEFYSQIEKMLNYEYLNGKIATRENLYLSSSEIHGATHANNVSLFATYIANSLNLSDRDVKTIIEASLYHDIGRTSDSNSNNHGELGAIKYISNVNCPGEINENEVAFLIEAHALHGLNSINNLFIKYSIPENDRDRLYKMATVIRDADALDRTRFCLLSPEVNLKSQLLVNDASKKIVESCQRLNYIIYQDYVKQKTHVNEATFTM